MRTVFMLPVLLLSLSACTTVSQVATRMAHPERAGQPMFSDRMQDDLYLGIIDGLVKQGRYEAALAFLDQYKDASPRAAVLRGDALVGAGYAVEAVAAYRKAADSSYAAAAYNGMGRAESAQRAWSSAIEDFRRASAIEPANAEYLNNIGYARLQLGGKDSVAVAMESLKRAHELDPESATIRNNLILAARLSNNHAQTVALLDAIPDAGERHAVADFAERWPDGKELDTRTGGGG
jgi:pentatricopeptide repeat protein